MANPTVQSDIVTNSGALAVSAAVLAAKALIYGVIVTAGADAASVTVYDNASAGTGTVLLTAKAGAGATVPVMCWPIRAANGLYATISGTTPSVQVLYRAL